MEATTSTAIGIRWMVRGDLERVLQMDRDTFSNPWTLSDWRAELRKRSNVAVVAERDREILGVHLYRLDRETLTILRLIVDPLVQRQGVGRLLVDRLQHKLSLNRRKRIECLVPDQNLPTHLFLKSCGFRAISVERNPYEDIPGDGYWFAYELPAKSRAA